MNKKEIVAKLAADSKQSESAVSSVLEALEGLAISMLQSKEKLVLPGFISIEAVARAARSGRNPQTGAVLITNAQGEMIGAVGASGGTGDEDEEIVIAGIAAAGLLHL